MIRNYPNITPPNDLRPPDALTIKHGPRELLARFALEGRRSPAAASKPEERRAAQAAWSRA